MRMVAARRWDIFCDVIDNFGDAAVCWRLAQQLVREHGCAVRLWINDTARLAQLVPGLRPSLMVQEFAGVTVCLWATPLQFDSVADVVIEAFACHLPDSFIAAMAQRDPKPLWINLEYLSAESWVADRHLRPSPHPRLPLMKYFFFPGFTADTGGLLREDGLSARRRQFQADALAQNAWSQKFGLHAGEGLKISLFAYPCAPWAELLKVWSEGNQEIVCYLPLVPHTQGWAQAWEQAGLASGITQKRGALTLLALPFLSLDDYDLLLWFCDLNFVRGEDSFVRAQWAARPMVWQIYPQADGVHAEKLAAFCTRYTHSLDSEAAQAIRHFWQAWNGEGEIAATWPAFGAALPYLQAHALDWAERQSALPDLATRLVNFSESKL